MILRHASILEIYMIQKSSSSEIDLAADDTYLCVHHMHNDKQMSNYIEIQLKGNYISGVSRYSKIRPSKLFL